MENTMLLTRVSYYYALVGSSSDGFVSLVTSSACSKSGIKYVPKN
jgi:hypothetical protein